MYRKNKKGQSTVEYVLLVTAVVSVMIVFATNKDHGFQQQLNSTLNTAASDMNDMADRLQTSHASHTGTADPTAGTPPYSVTVNP